MEAAADLRTALDTLTTSARLEHPASWLASERFEALAIERAGGHEVTPERLAKLRSADLYAAMACAEGVADALAWFEREHLIHVGRFVARIDPSAAFADEVRQRLRIRLLLRTEGTTPQLHKYSGSGSLGGWLRVCAAREARDMTGRPHEARELSDAGSVDPELAWLKERYGALVSDAFEKALAALGADERTMLKMHYVEGLTLEQVASVVGVSRATGARALARAREQLVDSVRGALKEACGMEDETADSLLAFVRSRIELDLAKHLT